ncbi:MAG: hypothetical protein HC937_02760 [Aquincola sp.]|nr:hypothetical protein [Aquincola sp.]
MEELRSFATFAGYAALAGGTETLSAGGNATNTSYTRSWSFPGSAATDPQRVVRVAVEWIDRAGEAQTVANGRAVTLMSVLTAADATEAGSWGVPPVANGILRRPLGRNINIPIPAVLLSGQNSGYSALPWGGSSGGFLVFSDISANVVYRCASQPDDNTDIAGTCTAVTAYLLLGFIGDSSNAYFNAINAATLTNTSPTTLQSECFLAAATDPNNGSAISGFKFYSCLVTPVDHDNDESTASSPTPRQWTGRLALAPAPTGNQKVCRYNGNQSNSVGRHIAITESIDNQNYLAINTGSCPSGTTQHQP